MIISNSKLKITLSFSNGFNYNKIWTDSPRNNRNLIRQTLQRTFVKLTTHSSQRQQTQTHLLNFIHLNHNNLLFLYDPKKTHTQTHPSQRQQNETQGHQNRIFFCDQSSQTHLSSRQQTQTQTQSNLLIYLKHDPHWLSATNRLEHCSAAVKIKLELNLKNTPTRLFKKQYQKPQ